MDDQESLSHDLFLLAAYLLNSAYGLFDEPVGYGPFRLLDATGRLLAILEAHGLSDPFLEQIRPAVDAERFGSSGDQELRARLDELCRQVAAELRKRTPIEERTR
jgi:Family of unknown function (DUF6092)